jgi:tRNA A37 threonylcarbamoyladenosine biosynthesis protein TsaE
VFAVPFVENIHQRVYEAIIENPKSFNMGSWHGQNSCGTTHCRAGWVIELAGEQGYALQKQTSPTFAALQIYKASCPELPVSPYRFHESNELALANIKEYAEKEPDNTGILWYKTILKWQRKNLKGQRIWQNLLGTGLKKFIEKGKEEDND